MNDYKRCQLCPRNCRVNRLEGQKGRCGMSASLYVARAALHMWEEPCLSGTKGSGTIFFSGCSPRCIFCQNYEIATGHCGKEISVERLEEICLELQEKGANNINLVTGVHYVPHIVKAISSAKKRGLVIPVIYNSSGYECVDTLRMLEGIVDIYLPDFKYMSEEAAKMYSHASDYSVRVKEAIKEMVRQVGEPQFIQNQNQNHIMKKGVIVRHLVLPGWKDDSKAIITYLHETYGDSIYISLMSQYTPLPQVKHIKPLNRRLTTYEYNQVVDYAVDLGVMNGFMQVGKTAMESFIPSFDYEGV